METSLGTGGADGCGMSNKISGLHTGCVCCLRLVCGADFPNVQLGHVQWRFSSTRLFYCLCRKKLEDVSMYSALELLSVYVLEHDRNTCAVLLTLNEEV